MNRIKSPRHNYHAGQKRADDQSPNTKSGSGMQGSRTSRHIRDCACGQGMACVGMTQAFRLLGDPRCYYVELPHHRKDPSAYKYVFRNNLRAAYLRHLKIINPNLDLEALSKSQERRYVALHHFHPSVVKSFYENPLTKGAAQKHKVPISITEHELKELNIETFKEDRILSVTGKPTGGFYFCPTYRQIEAHEDLKLLIKQERSRREERERQEKEDKRAVPTDIRVSTPKSSIPVSIAFSTDTPENNEAGGQQEKEETQGSEAENNGSLENIDELSKSPARQLTSESEIQSGKETKADSSMKATADTESVSEEIQAATLQTSPAVDPAEEQDTATVENQAGTNATSDDNILQQIPEPESSNEKAAEIQVVEEDIQQKPATVVRHIVGTDVAESSSHVDDTGVMGNANEDEEKALEMRVVEEVSQQKLVARIQNHVGTEVADESNEGTDIVGKLNQDEETFVEMHVVEEDIQKTSVTIEPNDDGTEEADESSHVKENGMMGKLFEEEDEFDAVLSRPEDLDFDNLWSADEPNISATEAFKQKSSQLAEESESWAVDDLPAIDDFSVHNAESPMPKTKPPLSTSRASNRETDHPWETPKYRRHKEFNGSPTKLFTVPAQFIDPTIVTPSKDEGDELLSKGEVPSDDPIDDNSVTDIKPPSGTKVSNSPDVEARRIDFASVSHWAAPEIGMTSIKEMDDDLTQPSKGEQAEEHTTQQFNLKDSPIILSKSTKSESSPSRTFSALSTSRSCDSEESIEGPTIALKHGFPGSDPTLRIQVHNDMIAHESKRRYDVSKLLEGHAEWWQKMRGMIRHAIEEVEFAERFVSGFAKAGNMFADSIQAVYDDKLLDDAGKTVSNSFLQNRLMKKRTAQEYSIENQDTTEAGQSSLLSSILEAQLEIAQSFRDTSTHILEEILPELHDLRKSTQAIATEYEYTGDSIIAELRRSEVELKNIWDVFDAMVTGDLMEYTVHGSLHGSQHGGSLHGPGFVTGMGSLHNMGGEGPILSSTHSPAVKSTFRQLGAVEDGWLIEMFYRSTATYQTSVFSIAENELSNLGKRLTELEERRLNKLHEVLLAFVPRQKRLFNALPEHLRVVLDDLVGLRIDEESLQGIIDESLKGRSRDHLKRGASHRSTIMNRSRINMAKENDTLELQGIEPSFGTPFDSPMVLVTKIVELQLGGIRGIVNAAFKLALLIVTSHGNLHAFTLPDQSEITLSSDPREAFQALFPSTTFETAEDWTRKTEITKHLTPTVTVLMQRCMVTQPKMHPQHIQIGEESYSQNGNRAAPRNRFMKAIRAAADSQRLAKCTLRVSSPSEANALMQLLSKTKSTGKKGSRFHF